LSVQIKASSFERLKPVSACAILVAAGLGLAIAAPGAACAAEAVRAPFGSTSEGQAVEIVTLTNHHGMTVRLMTLGASVQAVLAPDRRGRSADVVLGYDTLQGYLEKPNYFGATVGRFANRIAKGRFTLDGKTYQLPVNNGPNSLHGGTKGFDKVVWSIVDTRSGPSASVTFQYVSPDGDQGYPGKLTATATYALNERNELSVEYRAITDRPTIVNLSNHTYWNLAGEGAPQGALGEELTIPAQAYTPTDPTAIPTGEIRPVAGTPFDFRTAKPVQRDVRDGHDVQLVYGKGYDHNWVIARTPAAAPRLTARIEDPATGRKLEILSNQPGLQFYSGNFLDGTIVGKSGHIYREGDALVLEPQLFPDTPNHPEFGSARLDPGQTYRNLIIYRFGVTAGTPVARQGSRRP
jgi:aldose 1-epimerase